MSLLQALNLPVPRHLPPPGGGAPPPPTKPAPMAMPPTQGGAKPPPQAVAKPPGGDANPRAEALKLRGAVESRRAQALELLVRLQKVLPLLTSRVANTTGDEQKKLVDQHALLVRSIDDTKSKLARAEADLRVIDNAGSKDEELAAVIDRQRKAPKTGDVTAPGMEAAPNKALTTGQEGNVLKDKHDGKKSKEVKGVEVGVVGGLHANVTCNVGIATGEPKLYPVTLKVKFGGSAGISAKKGSNGAEVKGSITEQMELTRQLSESELADYIRKLEVASKGTPVGDARPEFGVITLGAMQRNWYAAYELYKTGKVNAVNSLKRSGDAIEVSREGSGTVGGSGGRGAVKVSGEVTETNRHSTSVKVNDQGRKEAEGKQEHGQEMKGSVDIQIGFIGVGVGGGRVYKTSVGYLFEIDPKDDPGNQILAELMKCESDEQYLYFMAKYAGKVKRLGTTIGQTDGSNSQVGLEVAGKKAEIGTGKGIQTEEKLDAKNRTVSKKTIAHNQSGGNIAGKGDSMKEEAVAVTGEDGKSTFEGKRTSEQNYGKKGKREVIFTLSDAACARIGRAVVRTRKSNWWDEQCWVGGAKADWKQAGTAILSAKGAAGAVSHALARFVGEEIDRMKIVDKLAGNLANRIEFPESLLRLRESYEVITDKQLPDKVGALAKQKGNAAAADYCKGLLTVADTLQPQIAACDDFENGNLKMKMLDELAFGRTRLHKAVLGFSGTAKPDEDANVLAQEGMKLYELCVRFAAEEAKLDEQLDDHSDAQRNRKGGRDLRARLEDLHKRWNRSHDAMTANFKQRKAPIPVPPMGIRLSPRAELIAKYTKKFPPLS
jgi:hypothetical protein